ncbi:hypothetical protein [Serratia rubidaea]|uniref:hypothetical protein n=1 Tax=Serratia rubidaea TaxID=61652 RepID=UPI0013E2D80D|nr:hypothetical protein [Serratia rubidaea]MBS0976127.1 hypothetical protein [Serratia rubidaea]
MNPTFHWRRKSELLVGIDANELIINGKLVLLRLMRRAGDDLACFVHASGKSAFTEE